MEKNHHIWRIWSNTLHRWGVQDLVASLLEAAGPLSIVAAQLIYVGQPILRGVVPERQLVALTGLLEDDAQRDAFVNYIRDGVQV
jgi:hypothetical protein